MTEYVGLIRRDGNTDFGVSFPDLPGLSSGGSTVHEALLSAQEALTRHLRRMEDRGGKRPSPSTIASLMDDDRLDRSIAVIVRVQAQETKVAA